MQPSVKNAHIVLLQDYIIYKTLVSCIMHFMHLAMHQKSESKSQNRVSRVKLEVSNVINALFILKQNNVRYGVIYYFSAVFFNYDLKYY